MTTRNSGFTLIEVLVALTLATLGILAVTLPAITATRNAVSLREQSLAHWVAMNHASDLRLAAEWPATGTSDGDVEFAGREWRWETEIIETEVEALRRAEISVGYADNPDQEIASIVAFIGEPTPGIQFRPWTGVSTGNPSENSPANRRGRTGSDR
ncbi:MAG: type II secretion system minor pseudopilin GspI [Gammaproteobacteria bacterium]|nr:type II secretion system minor pseudopilin GspI [Gammaproteobacteria bacterium]